MVFVLGKIWNPTNQAQKLHTTIENPTKVFVSKLCLSKFL